MIHRRTEPCRDYMAYTALIAGYDVLWALTFDCQPTGAVMTT